MSKSQNLATILKRPETSYGTLIQVLLAYHPKNPHYLHKIIIFTNIFIIYNKNHLHMQKQLNSINRHMIHSMYWGAVFAINLSGPCFRETTVQSERIGCSGVIF